MLTFQFFSEREVLKFVADIAMDDFRVTVELGRAELMTTSSLVNTFWNYRDVTVKVINVTCWLEGREIYIRLFDDVCVSLHEVTGFKH